MPGLTSLYFLTDDVRIFSLFIQGRFQTWFARISLNPKIIISFKIFRIILLVNVSLFIPFFLFVSVAVPALVRTIKYSNSLGFYHNFLIEKLFKNFTFAEFFTILIK